MRERWATSARVTARKRGSEWFDAHPPEPLDRVCCAGGGLSWISEQGRDLSVQAAQIRVDEARVEIMEPLKLVVEPFLGAVGAWNREVLDLHPPRSPQPQET